MNPFDPCTVVLLTKDRSKTDGQVSSTASNEHLSQIRKHWSPELRRRNEQDAHWDWDSLYQACLDDPSTWKAFALTVGEELQGIMRLQFTRRSRGDGLQHIVYVDRLSAAPWNRTDRDRRFRPVGRVLLRHAIIESIVQEFHGRIGLHSLTKATEWYKDDLAMTAYGQDPDYHNLEYFEYTQLQAIHFLDEPVRQLLRDLGHQVPILPSNC